jgi:hypothetical protein
MDLTTVVQQVIDGYAGPTLLGKSYAINDYEQQVFAVLVIPDYPPKFDSGIVVAARVVDDVVIIDEDTTDRPLWEELVRAGIPRQQIVCAYNGERRDKTQGDS